MQKYVELLSKFEKLQKEKSQELSSALTEVRRYTREKASMEAKITAQNKQMADQDNAYNLMVQSYEERVDRLKNQIQVERDEKMELLGEVNACQDQLKKQRIERENDPTITQLRSETAQMKIQLAKTRAELDNVKG